MRSLCHVSLRHGDDCPPAGWKDGDRYCWHWEVVVFWWFERNGTFMRFETRNVPGGFELHIVNVDGSERVERFDDSSQLTKRQTNLEASLAADGWTGPHAWLL